MSHDPLRDKPREDLFLCLYKSPVVNYLNMCDDISIHIAFREDMSIRAQRGLAASAAKQGHVSIIQWLADIGYDFSVEDMKTAIRTNIPSAGAQLEIVGIIGRDVHIKDSFYKLSVKSRKIEIVELFPKKLEELVHIASVAGEFELTKSLYEKIVSRSIGTQKPRMDIAVSKKSTLEQVKWIVDTVGLGYYFCQAAAKGGSLEIMKFLFEKGIEQGFKPDDEFYSLLGEIAITAGHDHIVHWIFETGIPVNGATMDAALSKARFDFVDMLLARGVEYSRHSAEYAARSGNVKLLDTVFRACYIGYRESPENTKYLEDVFETCIGSDQIGVMTVAVEAGDIEMVKWLRTKGFNIKLYHLAGALSKHKFGMVRFLVDEGCLSDPEKVSEFNRRFAGASEAETNPVRAGAVCTETLPGIFDNCIDLTQLMYSLDLDLIKYVHKKYPLPLSMCIERASLIPKKLYNRKKFITSSRGKSRDVTNKNSKSELIKWLFDEMKASSSGVPNTRVCANLILQDNIKLFLWAVANKFPVDELSYKALVKKMSDYKRKFERDDIVLRVLQVLGVSVDA